MNWRFWQKSSKSEDRKNSEEPIEEVDAEEVEAREAVGMMMELSSHENGDGDKYEKYRGTPLMQAIAPSGVWVVIKFSDTLEVGGVDDKFRNATIVRAAGGDAAIREVYTRDLTEHGQRANLVNAKQEDGRYVALDFYTGHRVEALVKGEWRAEMEFA